MTYDSALDYAIEHIPMNEYDNFDDWYDALEEKFSTPELTDSDTFGHDALDEWEKQMGIEGQPEEEPVPETPSKKEVVIDSAYVVTRDGIKPVDIVKAEVPEGQIPPQIIIDKTKSTARMTTREKIGSFFRNIFRFRRKK